MPYHWNAVISTRYTIYVGLAQARPNKAEKPSVCLSALFGRSDSQPWLHGSTSDLLDVIAVSSGMTKFIFKSF